ncbi:MAG: hypothetical protein ACI814_001057 [Mariniblastus sp.]|jgi:hypothetical protein
MQLNTPVGPVDLIDETIDRLTISRQATVTNAKRLEARAWTLPLENKPHTKAPPR